MQSKKTLSLIVMVEAAFMAAFAMLLDLLPSIQLSPFISISFAMVPIFIVSLRWGMKAGLLSGFLWGLLQVATGDFYFLTVTQFLIEYFIAFACIGFAGLLYPLVYAAFEKNQTTKASGWIIVAVLVGSLARYFWHFIAGVIFWGSFAPKGMSPVIYSLVVNGGTMFGVSVLCAFVLILLTRTSSRLIMKKRIKKVEMSILK